MNIYQENAEMKQGDTMQMRTLSDFFEENAVNHRHAPFITYFNEEYSYEFIYNEMKALLSFWVRRGINHKHTICLCLPNCPQFVISYLAALRMGSKVVLINPNSKPREIMQQLHETESAVLIYWRKMDSMIFEVAMNASVQQVISVQLRTYARGLVKIILGMKESPEEELVYEEGFHFDWTTVMKEAVIKNVLELYRAPQMDQPALLQYTGGSTGFPKAAVLTHGNLSSNA
ncbi:MAG: AMP-binding protein, partial [Bacilli bacterium]